MLCLNVYLRGMRTSARAERKSSTRAELCLSAAAVAAAAAAAVVAAAVVAAAAAAAAAAAHPLRAVVGCCCCCCCTVARTLGVALTLALRACVRLVSAAHGGGTATGSWWVMWCAPTRVMGQARGVCVCGAGQAQVRARAGQGGVRGSWSARRAGGTGSRRVGSLGPAARRPPWANDLTPSWVS
jgi:nucleoid-associated protein YgaU